VFCIQRYENRRDWRLLESQLTHAAWFLKLTHAVDYAAFRGRCYELAMRAGSNGSTETLIALRQAGESVAPIAPGWGPYKKRGLF